MYISPRSCSPQFSVQYLHVTANKGTLNTVLNSAIVMHETCLTSARKTLLHDWLSEQLSSQSWTLTPLAGDASFKRYHRCTTDSLSHIVAEALPEHLSLKPTITLTQTLLNADMPVPKIYATHLEQGFILQEDLGDQMLWHLRDTSAFFEHTHHALNYLHQLQQLPITDWPDMDAEMLLQECQLLPTWLLPHCKQTWNETDLAQYRTLCRTLIDAIEPRTFVPVHRDFHSRNLMIKDQKLYIIDFQDAVMGHCLYDLVSLTQDCYVPWSHQAQQTHLHAFYLKNTHQFESWAHCQRLYDWIGLQRYLKIAGIFARLSQRDHKPQFLKYMPAVLKHIQSIAQRYESFNPLCTLLPTLS